MNVNPDNGVPSDDLTPFAIEYCKSIGSKATTVSEILSTKDEKVMKAIQDGLDRANEHAVSRAQKVCWFLSQCWQNVTYFCSVIESFVKLSGIGFDG